MLTKLLTAALSGLAAAGKIKVEKQATQNYVDTSVLDNYMALSVENRNQGKTFAPIYIYSINNGKLTQEMITYTPYNISIPYMVYNDEVAALEVFGDWRHPDVMNYYQVDLKSGIPKWNMGASGYDGRMTSRAIHTPQVGTVCIGGAKSTSFRSSESPFLASNIIVTPPKSWNGAVGSLPDLDVARDLIGGVYFENRIYIVGGYSHDADENSVYSNTFAYLNIGAVQSAADTAALSWSYLTPLKRAAMPMEIQMVPTFNQNHERSLMAYIYGGIVDESLYNMGVEVYNIDQESSFFYDNLLIEGRYKSAHILTSTNFANIVPERDIMLTIMGGEFGPDAAPYTADMPAFEQESLQDINQGNHFLQIGNSEYDGSRFWVSEGSGYSQFCTWNQ